MESHAETNIPNVVRQHLAEQDIHHAVGPNKTSIERAEVCLLEDDQGLVQVFVSSHAIADLDKIKQVTGRALEPLSNTKIEQIKHQLKVQTLPAFDNLIPAVTIIDQSLFESENLFVHSGSAMHLVALQSAQAMKRLESTIIADIAIKLPFDDVDYELSLFEHDHYEINTAVSSFTTLRIKQRLAETLEIPPLSSTAQSIMKLRVDPDGNIEKLSAIVERDPSLAAQVVSWASSSYYSAPGSIKSVQDAIFRVLGYDLVMNLALGLSLGNTLEIPNEDANSATSYWRKAVYTAACVGSLISAIPREFRPSFGLSYLAGLLHNFGYLIMAHAFRPHFEITTKIVALNKHLQRQHIEKHVLGITSNQIAATLMHSWNMPGEVTMGIRYQNDPHYLGANSDQAHLIYLANHLLEEYGLLPNSKLNFDSAVYEYLKIDTSSIKQLMSEIKDNKAELDNIARLLAE